MESESNLKSRTEGNKESEAVRNSKRDLNLLFSQKDSAVSLDKKDIAVLVSNKLELIKSDSDEPITSYIPLNSIDETVTTPPSTPKPAPKIDQNLDQNSRSHVDYIFKDNKLVSNSNVSTDAKKELTKENSSDLLINNNNNDNNIKTGRDVASTSASNIQNVPINDNVFQNMKINSETANNHEGPKNDYNLDGNSKSRLNFVFENNEINNITISKDKLDSAVNELTIEDKNGFVSIIDEDSCFPSNSKKNHRNSKFGLSEALVEDNLKVDDEELCKTKSYKSKNVLEDSKLKSDD